MTKFVLRLLDAEGNLLGWAEVQGVARGNGALWMEADTAIFIRQAGVPSRLSVHWCDVNCEYSVAFPGVTEANVGNFITITAEGPLWTVGPAAGGLPPVEVASTVIGIPVGSLGMRTH
jgi:hypothetical protein